MNERIRALAEQAGFKVNWQHEDVQAIKMARFEKFAELIVGECVNREQLLGAVARGWCSEKNSHKTMDSDLALAIFDEVERQIKHHFGVE